jgi:nitrilase
MAIVRAAVVQDAPVAFQIVPTLEKIRAWLARAAAAGVSLAVFPEAFLGGYPKGHDFGARVGFRTPEGRDWFRRYCEAAIPVPGAETAQLAEWSHEFGLWFVLGVIERIAGTLYCTALTFSPQHGLAGIHRKTMPTAMERLVWGWGDGSTLRAVVSPWGPLAMAICWENYMPLLRTQYYAQSVHLWCAPTVDDRETWLSTMRHIALEGRCFVLSANQFARRGDYPGDYPVVGESSDVLIRGGSCIIGPLGELLAGPLFGEPAILTAELDLDQIPRARMDFDATGHYGRPDLFQLHVNRSVQQVVMPEVGE